MTIWLEYWTGVVFGPFWQKGTLMLKEMLKIDGAGTGSPASQEAAVGGGQQHNRRRSSKKLGKSLIPTPCVGFQLEPCFISVSFPAANMNAPHSDAAAAASPSLAGSANLSNAVLTSKVAELACVCAGLGMAPPDFSYIGSRQVGCVCVCVLHQTP